MRVDFANSKEVDGMEKLYRIKRKKKKEELERATQFVFMFEKNACDRVKYDS